MGQCGVSRSTAQDRDGWGDQKIKDFVVHDLRRSAVTNLADAGVNTETIKKIVGYSSVEMFLRYCTTKVKKLDATIPGI